MNAPYGGYGTYVIYCSCDVILVNPSNFISVDVYSILALVLPLSISCFQPCTVSTH